MDYTTSKIRNIAVLGHQGSGKTSLIESLCYATGGISTKGLVEKGNTVSDYLPYEVEKGCSFNTSLCPVFYQDYKFNFIDVPGSEEFSYEMENVLNVVKGAVLVIDASSGVEVGTANCFRSLKKRHIPCVIFINKMDKENVRIDRLVDEIKTKLGKFATLFAYPTGHEDNFDGFCNVVDLKARKFNGVECVDDVIYDDKKVKIMELHNEIIELVAQTSDELLEKFFEGETLTKEEVHTALRQSVLDGEIAPILVGSAIKNIGVHTLLEMMIDYLPNPQDLKPIEGEDLAGNPVEFHTSDEEPFSAYVFKTIVDPFLGTINIFKIFSGSVTPGMEIMVNGESVEKIKDLYYLSGKKQVAVEKLSAGDIGAVTKINGISTGMTLSTPKNPVKFAPTEVPNPTQYLGIVAASKNDEDKLSTVLQKLMVEDPAIQLQRNVETSQLLIGGQGLHHLQYQLDKVKRIYKVNLNTEKQKIVYRETIKATAEATGTYKKHSGGAGFYGVVVMRFEPTTEDSYFSEEVFGGAVPKNYFPAVEKGFYEALEKGPLAGYPVINVHATLFDGKYHAVDSNELSFKMAAILAFKEAYKNCRPVLLEPIMRVKISVQEQYLGDVISDVSQRRGRISGMENSGELQLVEAFIPEAEIIDYKIDLSSMTQGNGKFSREFYGYEEVPAHLVDAIIAESQK